MLIKIDNIQSLHKIKIYKYDNIDSKSLNSNCSEIKIKLKLLRTLNTIFISYFLYYFYLSVL